MSLSNATTLNIALQEIGMSAESYLGVANKLFMGLKGNEEAFHDLVITIRDVNGGFLEEPVILSNVISKLMEYKAGTDRMVIAKGLLKRVSGDVIAELVRLADQMEHARTIQEQLGLTVSEKGVDSMYKYREAMADLKLVFTAVAGEITRMLMPVILELCKLFLSVAPAAIDTLKGAVLTLKLAFYGLITVLQLVADFLNMVIDGIIGGAKIIVDALSGRWDQIATDAKKAWNQIKFDYKQMWVDMTSYGAYAADQISKTFAKLPSETMAAPSGGKGAPRSKPAETKEAKSRMPEWEAEFAAEEKNAMDLEGEFISYSLEQTLAFWQKKLDIEKLSQEESVAIKKRIADIEKAIYKDLYESEVADLMNQLESFDRGDERRVDKAYEIAQRIGDAYGYQSRQYINAMRLIESEEKAHQKKMLDLQLAGIDAVAEDKINRIELERERVELEYEIGEISRSQEIEALRRFADEEFSINLQRLQDKLALLDIESEAYQNLLEQIKELERRHNSETMELNAEAVRENKSTWEKFMMPISRSFDSAIQSMITGTMKFRTAMKRMLGNIILDFISATIRMVALWAAHELAKTTASIMGVTIRKTTEEAGQKAGLVAHAAASIKYIISSAAKAAAGAYSAVVGIPYVGPILAPIAAAVAFVAVAAFQTMVSAKEGFDVPNKDITTRLHAREMVLPAPLAEKVRGMTSLQPVFSKLQEMISNMTSPVMAMAGSYGVPADITAKVGAMEMGLPASAIERIKTMATASETRTETKHSSSTFNIKSWDSKDMTRALRSSRSPLGKAIKELMRDGHIRTK